MLKTKEVLSRLKALREERDLKQGSVAKWLGIDRTTYVRKEKGLIPITTEEWLRLAEALNEAPSYFFSTVPGGALDERESAVIALYRALRREERENLIAGIICMYEGTPRKEIRDALEGLKKPWP